MRSTRFRPIWQIAKEIPADAFATSHSAYPFMIAMLSCTHVDDQYGCETARDVILYFFVECSYLEG